ncbi:MULTISPECIES: arylesterase [Vibrio]|jgi:acyl-CoA thioesterase-1|uniref:Arylesterase n=1 Tax=Vibrio natriegens NBRC 15636 = ATCC 14048 = DSM 759 TaxID=1219067 RepID=A0AAN0Y6Z8_VIBNA|nr:MULTISPECIES: arylesterase [Vibrio]MEE3876791.1 arylesterase [Vibrio sp. YYF0003]WMN90208.1 arylesterase [Vibrio parahaemolyticus]AEX24399.1 arylesterase [Vibrio sp. EJY3]ALR18342.1 arylesterase [Vibrio natriegens NBRC 15636 = ATCC 14048 = DSM 759]ANQ14290.1 arylesterase [Vibrio natriegens NBRC 15636 = ATCC 14048 = DSM 759]
MIRLLSLVLFFCFSVTAFANEKLLVLGDSLSAGYNMPIEKSWPSLLPDVLLEHGQTVTVINGSISGDTTGNGLARLPQLLEQHSPSIVLIELGANDGLRGFPPKLITSNLSKMITMIKDFGAEVIMMQIRVPPNYGKRYSDMFYDIYPKLAEHQQVQLMPFFLEHLVTKPDWMMNDGLHPKPEAQPWIADFVAQELIKHL